MDVRASLYIGGEWVAPSTSDVIDVISPFTELPVARVPDGSAADIDAAVSAARHAFDTGPWPVMPPTERLEILDCFADLYEESLETMAALITEEMGAPISFSRRAQGPSALQILRYFIELGAVTPWDELREGTTGPVLVCREPLGVVGAIVPWNVPQIATMAKLAPALVAGCTVVLKPAPEAPLDSLFMSELLIKAGMPPGVVNVVPAGREVGEALVRHPSVDKIAFTGSTAAGRRIAAICGESLRRCTLELGGKSAAIVLDDADLDVTANGIKRASLMNNGQTCFAHTRILASRSRYADVVDSLASMMEAMTVGDPADPSVEIGPLAAQRQQARVQEYLSIGTAEGARLIVGGVGTPDGMDRGWFVRPTLFADVDNGMRVAREEIFGPVLVVIPYDDVDDAVRIANDSDYGLSGSVWTSDDAAGLDVARQVRTGHFGVNRFAIDFVAPFGGYKASGMGREFAPEGLDHYIEFKSILP